jgi:DNA-binding sugar fermentation-stimulating protein
MKKNILPIIALLLTHQLMAQTELKTKSISVFKNGQAFVIKEGEVATTNNIYTLKKIPDALFGTLWFAGLQSDIVQVTSKQEAAEESADRKVISFRDLLFANKNKSFTLTTNDDKIYNGTVEDFDLQNDPNSTLLIKTNKNWISILPSSIKNIEFSDKPAKVFVQNNKTVKPVIKIQFAKSGNQLFSIMYLQNGISWMPTYLLELKSETEAQLKMQAEVINDAEDLVNTNMNFVVGVPNFKFAGNPATLTAFAKQQYENNYHDSRYSNALMSQVAADAKSYAEMEMSVPAVDNNIEADASEDFYFYNLKNVNLEKGERAHFPLFNIPIKIKHLYECSLPNQNENMYRSYIENSVFSFNAQYSNVHHSIEISNDSKNPFTTASVMIIDGKTQRPLSEDLIKYTGIGQKSSIELTQSPDIKVKEQERIIASKTETKKRNGYDYEYKLLTVQSEVVIVNSKKQNIEMVIYKNISGKSKKATVNYTSNQTPTRDMNPTDKLKFNLNVKAGETSKFTYTYEKYVQE